MKHDYKSYVLPVYELKRKRYNVLKTYMSESKYLQRLGRIIANKFEYYEKWNEP